MSANWFDQITLSFDNFTIRYFRVAYSASAYSLRISSFKIDCNEIFYLFSPLLDRTLIVQSQWLCHSIHFQSCLHFHHQRDRIPCQPVLVYWNQLSPIAP